MDHSQSPRLEERIGLELLWLTTMIVVALVQVTLLPTLRGFSPAFVLVVIICRILVETPRSKRGTSSTFRGAFYGGLTLDVCTSSPFGSHELALLVAAVLVFILAWRFRITEPFFATLIVVPAGVVYEMVLTLVYTRTVPLVDWVTYFGSVVLPGALVSFLPALPVLLVIRWLTNYRQLARVRRGDRT